jgi:tRNA (guanine-N7-)-methyltransferase
MRPEQLELPFSWNVPCTLIQDRVWYVLERAPSDFTFPGWSDPLLFGNTQPVCVEYCSGNGAWIAHRAQQNPQVNWVAVEKKFARARKIWSKIKNLQLDNLIVLCGEGHFATQCYFPQNSIKEVFINFPDPWPKRRHAGNRLIQPAFTQQLHRVLEQQALLNFVTDDAAYSSWFISVMQAHGKFQSLYGPPFYTIEQPEYGSSYFEELWRSKARTIRYHQLRKTD